MTDALLLTAISTAALAGLVPLYIYVAWEFIAAWRGGEPIPYFAPTVFLIASVAAGAGLLLIVAFSALSLRLTGNPILPPGVGLFLLTVGLFLPAAPMLLLLRRLRDRRVP